VRARSRRSSAANTSRFWSIALSYRRCRLPVVACTAATLTGFHQFPPGETVDAVMALLTDLALLLAVPAYLTALAAVVLLAIRRSTLRDSRRCPPPGTGAR